MRYANNRYQTCSTSNAVFTQENQITNKKWEATEPAVSLRNNNQVGSRTCLIWRGCRRNSIFTNIPTTVLLFRITELRTAKFPRHYVCLIQTYMAIHYVDYYY